MKMVKSNLNRTLKKSAILLILMFSSLLFVSNSYAQRVAINGGVKGGEIGGGLILNLGNFPICNVWNLEGVASLQRYCFTTGFDNFFRIGVQARRWAETAPVWYGGELSFVHDVSVYEDSYWDSNPSGSGVAAGVLAGYRLPIVSLNISAFVATSLIYFGEFTSDGHLVEGSHTALQGRIGLEISLGSIE